MKEEIFKDLGLTDSETKVYLALIELGDSTRGDIVNESQIAGSKVYEILEKLQEKGLVSIYIKDKIKHFKPLNPRQILNYLEDKKEKIKKIESQFNSILPELMFKFTSSKEKQEVELLQGIKGLEIIFREQIEMLSKGELAYVIGGTKGGDEPIIHAFFEKIHVMRQQKKIKTKMLFNIQQKKSTEEHYSAKKFPNTETRYIENTAPVAINVWKNRTAILIFGEKINTIYIKSQKVADSFIGYFNLLWQNAKN